MIRRAYQWVLHGGLNTKLVRVFILQILAISVATVMGVYAAAWVVEKVLVREALNGEAEHFWSLYAEDPQIALPNTNNLLGYLAPVEDLYSLPGWLRDEEPGFRRVNHPDGDSPVIHVTDRHGARLYLVFDEVQVSSLAFYFGIAPLTAVLMIIYLLTWVGYLASRRAVSTVVQLADLVRNFDFNAADFDALRIEDLGNTSDPEVLALVTALNQFTDRLQSFVRRERNFTRNASHELRTPLAVLKSNLELLRQVRDEAQAQAVVERMNRTVRDMEALVETLLILARESESKLSWSSVVLNDLLAEQLDQVQRAIPKADVRSEIRAGGLLEVNAPERVLAIIFTNLLRNAMNFTEEGEVNILIDARGVTVKDSGCGMCEADLERAFEPFYRGHDRSNEGYGLGLAIVRRLCDRFDWPIHADSEIGEGTQIRVEFPRATFRPFRKAQ